MEGEGQEESSSLLLVNVYFFYFDQKFDGLLCTEIVARVGWIVRVHAWKIKARWMEIERSIREKIGKGGCLFRRGRSGLPFYLGQAEVVIF